MSFYTFMPKLLNMSLTASVAIVLVILLRLLLKRAPKVISYALWGVVLFRLLCPVSIGSSFSLYRLLGAPIEETGMMTSVIEYVPSNIVHTEYPSVTLPVPGVSDVINEVLPQGEEQLRADPLEGPIFIATCVWMAGVLVMAVYSIISYIQLRRKLAVVVSLRDNIFIADDIRSPFVVGLFWPRIYLPCNLGDKEQEYIILHEQHHIKRLDHIMKALAFLALAVHWFNPLAWVAFILASKDMEMSCDEAVIRKVGSDVRADYSASLLTLATGRRIIAGTPLAFGEGDTKGRIRNLAKWKKPVFGVVLISVIACVALAVGLLTNPIKVFEGYYRIEGYGISNGREYHIVVNDNIELTCTKEQYEQVVNLVERFRTGELDDMPIYVAYKQFLISYKRGTVLELEIPQKESSGKTYVYENEGIMGSFTITLFKDGTFAYCEGMASSYLGFGSWKQEGDVITLTDDGDGGYGLVNRFKRDGDDLVFMAEGSSNFVYVKVQNGERFHRTGEAFKPNGAMDAPELGLQENIVVKNGVSFIELNESSHYIKTIWTSDEVCKIHLDPANYDRIDDAVVYDGELGRIILSEVVPAGDTLELRFRAHGIVDAEKATIITGSAYTEKGFLNSQISIAPDAEAVVKYSLQTSELEEWGNRFSVIVLMNANTPIELTLENLTVVEFREK